MSTIGSGVLTRAFDAPCGRVIGRVDGGVVRVLGLPYARTTRFEPPQPVPPLAEPFEALHRAPACPQTPSEHMRDLIEGVDDGVEIDEQCTRLSITLPGDLAPGERLPVLVWVHGGSYVMGAGDLAIYDPDLLVAEQRVVVVSVTYRLGVFGFLGLRTSDGETPANLGLLDLLAALRWIAVNIGAFGGDPELVTLVGQSAGGDAIAHLMIARGAEGLFRRAIIQSAPLGIAANRARMTAAMRATIGEVAQDASAEHLLELEARAERATRRFGLRGGMPFGVAYGCAPLPAERHAPAAWRAVAPHVDVLIGSTAEETTLFVYAVPALQAVSRVPLLGPLIRRAAVAFTTWAVYAGPAHRFARRHRAAGGTAVRYRMTWAPEGSPLGAAHITDVPLLLGTRASWGHTKLLGSAAWDDVERRGRTVRRIWAEFARTGAVSPGAAAPGTIELLAP